MKKDNVELTSKILTVEDAINVLLTVPKNYTLNTLGHPLIVCVDHGIKSVSLLEAEDAEEYIEEVKADLKSVGDPFEIEVPDENLLTCEDDVYRKLWAKRVKQDVEDYSKV